MKLLPPPSDVADMLSLEPKHKRFLWCNTSLWWRAKIVSKNNYFIIHSILYTKKYNPPDQNIFHQGTMPWISKKLRISVKFICFSGPKSNKPVNINIVSWGLDINELRISCLLTLKLFNRFNKKFIYFFGRIQFLLVTC